MKTNDYETLQIEVIKFGLTDIILTSNNEDTPNPGQHEGTPI